MLQPLHHTLLLHCHLVILTQSFNAPREHPLLEFRLLLRSPVLSVLHRNVHYLQRFLYHSEFYFVVERGVGGEAGGVVDFEEPWFEVFV